MGRPHQFAARAASRSARVTCGPVPGRFAQPADRRSAVSCHPPPRSNAAMLPSSSRPVNPWFVLDSTPSSSRRFAMLTIHALPDGRRRPILIMAFSGWNDAAEAATTAARYLATAFRAEKFAEIDPEEFYHFGLSRPYVRFKAGSETDREIVWPVTEFSIAQVPDLARDLIVGVAAEPDRKSTRLNSSHLVISYAVFCLKKKNYAIYL